MMDEKEIEEKLGGIQILLKPKRDFERPESGKTIADFECFIIIKILYYRYKNDVIIV